MSPPSKAPIIAASKLFRGRSHGPALLVGREKELADLDAAWASDGSGKRNVVTIVAWGGVGKTSLVAHWAEKLKGLARDRASAASAIRTSPTALNSQPSTIQAPASYFDWSFYSQGTRREGDATGADKAAADLFIKEALEFFGDPALAASNAGAWQKGERLAQLVGQQRALLVLDGLEPLQDAKTGDLRDEALRALLRGLAANNRGLCLVTTRQHLPELNVWRQTTAPQWTLENLSPQAGAELLVELGVTNSTLDERTQLAKDVKGHALTLTLLGRYLAEAHGGDIRRRDQVSLTEADYEETSGHAFRVMEAYEQWLERDGRRMELAILRLLGLFDRPATPDCLAALCQLPAIPGLTESLLKLPEVTWNLAVSRLVKLGLVEEQPWEGRRVFGYGEAIARQALDAGLRNVFVPVGEPQPFETRQSRIASRKSLEAHPLIREYFANRLRLVATNAAWRVAHERLFEHLRQSVPYWPEGLDGLQPLYQAVAHGCHAGRYQAACDEVYANRICRGADGPHAFYSSRKLGAIGADLAAVGCFFVAPWTTPTPGLAEADQAWLLNAAAFRLRALGRLTDARKPMRAGIELYAKQGDVRAAAMTAGNLSELELTLGEVATAIASARQSVEFADRSGDEFQRMSKRVKLADALNQSGRSEEARRLFEEAEATQNEQQRAYPLLSSVHDYLLCDLLLSNAERAAGRVTLKSGDLSLLSSRVTNSKRAVRRSTKKERETGDRSPDSKTLREVEKRATQALQIGEHNRWLLTIALDHLTLGRAALYGAILEPGAGQRTELWHTAVTHMDAAVQGLRDAGQLDDLPRGLLTRAWLRRVQGQPDLARQDLDEAWQIAERSSMRLFMADAHLARLRLFGRTDPYPWRTHPDGSPRTPRDDLAAARRLITDCGYHRRDAELADMESVFGTEPRT